MIRYAVERIKCEEKGCDKEANVRLVIFPNEPAPDVEALYCTGHADFYIARLDEVNAEAVRK